MISFKHLGLGVVLFLLCWPRCVLAQTPQQLPAGALTLDRAVELASANYPAIRAAQARLIQ